MVSKIATILYLLGSLILFIAGLFSAFGCGVSKSSIILAIVSTLYALANILLFVILPNWK